MKHLFAPLALFACACASENSRFDERPNLSESRTPAPSLVAPKPEPETETEPELGQEQELGPAPPLVETTPEHAEGDLWLGSIAGDDLLASDLIQAWHGLSSRDLWIVIDKLVAVRLARAEAGRLGVILQPEAIALEVSRERDRLEREIEANAPGVKLEDFVAGRLGVDPERYFANLRTASIERMLTERVVRAWILSQESRAVRLVVVREEDADAVQADLDAGISLADVATDRSLDDTGKQAGLVPFLVKSEGSVLAQAAFGAPVGELVGPLINDDLRLFLRVESVRPARVGNWEVLGQEVEESLAEIPLGDSEYVPWKLAMERTWPIDLEPLGNLVGAAH